MSNCRTKAQARPLAQPSLPPPKPPSGEAHETAVAALAALAQETRLAVFRLLVRAGPSGLPAGSLARALGVQPSTLSHHLAELERARLVRRWRVERQIFCAADLAGARRLIAYLVEDCCDGRPEICGDRAPMAASRGCQRLGPSELEGGEDGRAGL
ncbi:MAG: ArsR/SmtB family transcription factor [Pseudomonadota bacterium]